MNRFLLAFVALLSGATLIATDAEAARLGGARSSGMQRNVTAPPARQAQPAAQPQAPAAAPASGLSRWMPMLGGLAIGGLLGSMFGGGLGGFGGVLMMLLLAAGVFLLARMLMRPRAPVAPPLQYAGFGNERSAGALPSQALGGETPALAAPNIPAGFDSVGFLRAAKMNFIRLQVANDSGDLEVIRELATPTMFDELNKDVQGRGAQKQQTDIVTVEADLLEVATERDMNHASVRFSGMVRDAPGSAPKSFSEVWNLAKPLDGSTGWLLAGIQQDSANGA